MRDELDRYYTPRWCADDIVTFLAGKNGLRGLRVLEPHAGAGSFVQALYDHEADVVAMDKDPEAPARKVCRQPMLVNDFLDVNPSMDYHLITGNPPFASAEVHVCQALQYGCTVAFLLRAGFYESNERSTFFRTFPPSHVMFLPRRPSYLELYEDGTVGPLRKRDPKTGEIMYGRNGRARLAGVDNTMYALFVWPPRGFPPGPTLSGRLPSARSSS